MTYLEHLLDYVKAYFYVAPSSDDIASYTTVVRLTSTEVQTHVAFGKLFDFFAPLNDAVYASENGVFWRWSGDRFEEASSEEQDMLQRLEKHDFTDTNGWSIRRSLAQGRAFQSTEIEVEGEPLTGSEASVDISKPAGQVERVFSLDQRLNRIASDKYQQIFERRSVTYNTISWVF